MLENAVFSLLFYFCFPIKDSLPVGLPGNPAGSDGKEFAFYAGDTSFIPGSERYPGKVNGNPLQYSCLENSMEREASRLPAMGLQRVRYD